MKNEVLRTDALVVGAGPAALSLAAALLERGIETLCVAPSLLPWEPNYGAWADEVAGLTVPVSHAWPRARISFPGRPPLFVDRRYVKLDGARLFADLSARLTSSGSYVCDSVSSAFFDGVRHVVTLRSVRTIQAAQVFDASGHAGLLTSRNPTSPAFQTAFGVTMRRSHDPTSLATMGLMTWDNGVSSEGRDTMTPAFYYEMPLSEEESFVEYTVLAARPLIPVDLLRAELEARAGSEIVPGAPVERCVIPMGHAVPALDQPVVGFGGAASMVHPATGYMAARVLRAAPALAEAYAATRGRPPEQRHRDLWQTVWPEPLVRTHELYRFGLEALLTFDAAQTHEFFAAFFALPDELWQPYQSGTATPREVATAMWEVFWKVSAPMKLKLAAAGLGPHAPKLRRLLH